MQRLKFRLFEGLFLLWEEIHFFFQNSREIRHDTRLPVVVSSVGMSDAVKKLSKQDFGSFSATFFHYMV